MFTGHYGVSFALKGADRAIPLWLLFIAVQFVDVLWAVFVFLGIERVRIVPGFTATNPLDLYYMPYTHSLTVTVVWFAVAVAAYRLRRGRAATRAALLVGLAVASHWFLDLIVHIPDLPLYDDTAKVGLGLWNYPVPAFLLEAALLFGGMALYLRRTRPLLPGVGRQLAFPIFGVIMLAIHATTFFGPPPISNAALATTALSGYLLFAAVAWWLERQRA
jgi:membrane-bound metal-dependent hydrolase YbcI (DUF457 family)